MDLLWLSCACGRACFPACVVGVVGCGWESLTLVLHRTLLRAGAEHCFPGPAGCLAYAQGGPRASGEPVETRYSRHCEARLASGALPPSTAHLWGPQPGLVAHACAQWRLLRGWLPPGGDHPPLREASGDRRSPDATACALASRRRAPWGWLL